MWRAEQWESAARSPRFRNSWDLFEVNLKLTLTLITSFPLFSGDLRSDFEIDSKLIPKFCTYTPPTPAIFCALAQLADSEGLCISRTSRKLTAGRALLVLTREVAWVSSTIEFSLRGQAVWSTGGSCQGTRSWSRRLQPRGSVADHSCERSQIGSRSSFDPALGLVYVYHLVGSGDIFNFPAPGSIIVTRSTGSKLILWSLVTWVNTVAGDFSFLASICTSARLLCHDRPPKLAP